MINQNNNTFQINQLDAIDWLKSLPNESVDLIITDVAYESLEKHRKTGTTTRLKKSKSSSNNWFPIFPNNRFDDFFKESYRVLKKNSHLYFFCDNETMFYSKPIGEQNGFKFWKPIIWDKCLHPDTLVSTPKGIIKISEIFVGDYVETPNGTAKVLATRKTYSDTYTMKLSDNTNIVCSPHHIFKTAEGMLKAENIAVGSEIIQSFFTNKKVSINVREFITEDEVVVLLPDRKTCLWCNKKFDSVKAASAHSARWCEKARSIISMAKELNIRYKKLQFWINKSQMPEKLAKSLKIPYSKENIRFTNQNDPRFTYPETINLDFNLGRFVGLFAAEGTYLKNGLSFAFHSHEKHLHNFVESFARQFGANCSRIKSSNLGIQIIVYSKFLKQLVLSFIKGNRSFNKFFTSTVYNSNDSFIEGIFQGLNEGDGHWESSAKRWKFTTTSKSLSSFIIRFLSSSGHDITVSRRENNHSGFWSITWDPKKKEKPNNSKKLTVVNKTYNSELCELIDISIDDKEQLFVLWNGAITHNCKIGMGYHYRNRYENILFFEKGKKKLNNLSIPDVLQFKRIKTKNSYPTEKPVDLFEVLIKQSSQTGEIVCDPFMGSGNCGVAAVKNNRIFWGNDISNSAYIIAETKLNKELNK